MTVKHTEITDDQRSRMLRALASLHDTEPTDELVIRAVDIANTTVELLHSCSDGSAPVALPFDRESVGTKSLIALTGPITDALAEGHILLVDELDTSLHPRLVAELVRLFQNPETNPLHAQLIFTSHDTTLLGHIVSDTPVMERGQVWFVQKNTHGASEIYPLSDFKPRKAEDLERGYLQGRYGAVPLVDFETEFPYVLSVVEGAE
ncbi:MULTISPECIES: AAA family ATPase [unclassified Kribbella]|uniref:AAA family ATPase n=1 Tax=unclassified Kribbella TaxID=2644121 RepID=UPI0030788111